MERHVRRWTPKGKVTRGTVRESRKVFSHTTPRMGATCRNRGHSKDAVKRDQVLQKKERAPRLLSIPWKRAVQQFDPQVGGE